ncbi:MAG: sugar phosphate nucleotidyltransferase, partial [Pseudomonadota bacterium]
MTTTRKTPTIHPVILCGGSGTRLWPVSRKSYPKQFTALLGDETLFQTTLRRAAAVTDAAPFLVTHEDFRFIVADQVQETGLPILGIGLEPEARDTGPAVCLAALAIARTDPDALMLVLPSDHLLDGDAAFRTAVGAAAVAAHEGVVATFGIQPTRA